MNELTEFLDFSTCNYADFLADDAFMDIGIKPLWSNMPRLVGRAFTVKCEAGDNLMVHAAIYKAPPGSILVIDAGDSRFAVAGGNVCATAAERGILGFIIDGAIRDVGEIREMKFPVYARGNVPKPGKKLKLGEMKTPIKCGGININNGDIIVADEEGIVVIKPENAQDLLAKTKAKQTKESKQSLKEWQAEHYQKISSLVTSLGL
ncbi:RraA family protein [Francisella sp. 19X1-34]|uniref:RraA family protein n=1 Tax=Francisella sp. 19X1-34 TaxID=3087177 RepID=UPI002E345046|nr:RraA family protein [Francisella sp. 19X1-34]MED7789151.1 RraA family protein [Francisella sp. 19X1-34]